MAKIPMLLPKFTYTPVAMSTLVVFDIFTVIGPDAFAFAVLGIVGSFIGSLVRIVRRDEADIENKINFLYWKDIFITLVWTMAGGFFPLVFAAQGWPPLLAVACSPFMPRFWDIMENFIPEMLKSVLNKFIGSSGSSNSPNGMGNATGDKK